LNRKEEKKKKVNLAPFTFPSYERQWLYVFAPFRYAEDDSKGVATPPQAKQMTNVSLLNLFNTN